MILDIRMSILNIKRRKSMVEKNNEPVHDEAQEKPKKGGKKKILIIIVIVILLLGGGFFGYSMVSGGKTKEESKKAEDVKAVLVALDPFIVNLADHGRYLKMTMQLEFSDKSYEAEVKQKMPNLRDAIIILLSGKSSESVSGPEGKLQLKDEILLRANQSFGKDIFKNLYFTEFVLQ